MWRFRPLTLLAGLVAPATSADGVGAFDRLGVHAPGRGHRVADRGVADRGVADRGVADRGAQPVVDAVHGAVGVPGREVVIDRGPRWQVPGQLAPRTAGTGLVEDRVDDLATGVFERATPPPTAAFGRQQRGHQSPLGVG